MTPHPPFCGHQKTTRIYTCGDQLLSKQCTAFYSEGICTGFNLSNLQWIYLHYKLLILAKVKTFEIYEKDKKSLILFLFFNVKKINEYHPVNNKLIK